MKKLKLKLPLIAALFVLAVLASISVSHSSGLGIEDYAPKDTLANRAALGCAYACM